MLTGRENLTKSEAAQYNPITLAFIGDAVFSMYVRERLALGGIGRAADYQRAAVKLVSAKGQSAFLERLLPLLTEDEGEIYRRGKNAKKATKSKNASSLEYNRSTGFEAVLGYLYLLGDEQRIGEILSSLTDEDFKIPEKTQGLRSFR